MTPVDFIRRLDPKLVATVLTTLLTRGALGLVDADPILSRRRAHDVISLAVGAVAGYFWPNDGTVLRQAGEVTPAEDSGGLDAPKVEHLGEELADVE